MTTKVKALFKKQMTHEDRIVPDAKHFHRIQTAIKFAYGTSEPGADPGRGDWGDRPALLKHTKVTSFTMILYSSEKSISDIRSFCHPLFCGSSVVKYISPLLVVNPRMRLDCQYYWNRPLPERTGWIRPCREPHYAVTERDDRFFAHLQDHSGKQSVILCFCMPFKRY